MLRTVKKEKGKGGCGMMCCMFFVVASDVMCCMFFVVASDVMCSGVRYDVLHVHCGGIRYDVLWCLFSGVSRASAVHSPLSLHRQREEGKVGRGDRT